ncbi:MAG: NHL repeat-containing protein [Proteobacteria bacterium]|nr:NHL repeat-containing protein [Pseudomonadota bacterium]MBU1453255.1 NHL repeat-containing protein [Pseudomonadota bacterium]
MFFLPVILFSPTGVEAGEDLLPIVSDKTIEDPLNAAPAVESGEADPLNQVPAVEVIEEPLNLISYRTVFVISDLLRLPSDVDVDGEGRIYVLDGTANIVRVYSQDGKPLFTLGDEKTLKFPLGVDVSPAGDVLVADSGNHRIVLFSAKAAPPRFFDLPSPPGGKPTDPTDVVFAKDLKRFFVVDNDNHRVIAVDINGEILWSSGKMGRNPEEFRFPFLMDIDNEDNLYIVEVVNTRVQVLNKDGIHVRFIGDWGIEPGQFFRPKGIAIGQSRDLLVSDSFIGVVQMFSQGGDFLGVIGDETGKVKKFTTPMGMKVYGDRLFVIEMYTNRLVVLEREGP